MHKHKKNIAETMLQEAHLQHTAARLAVLEALLRAQRPETQQQIAARLVRKRLNKVTVYRTLEAFTDNGLVHKAFLRNRTWHFELARNCTENQCHPHFTCNECGLTKCMLGLSVPMVKGLEKGFVVKRQQVRLEGFCPKCNPTL